jgi:spermidine synthase
VLQAENAFAEKPAENVLVIGAAGFTFPRDVAKFPAVKQVDAVDVDPIVRSVAEKQFLKQPLPPKVRFLPLSARYAVRKLHRDGAHYGFTLVDAYFGQGIPDELVTAEFFRDVRMVSDRTAINVVMDRDMDSKFAINLLQTFREANGEVWIRDVKTTDTELTNVLVTNWPAGGSIRWNGKGHSYHDDKSTADRDHVDLFWGV